MSVERQLIIWAAVAVALVLLALTLGSALTPFVMGIVLGYLLDPVVQQLHRLGLSRLFSALLILVLFVVLVSVALVIAAPILANQLVGFATQLPGYLTRLQSLTVAEWEELVQHYGGDWINQYGLTSTFSGEQIQRTVNDFVEEGSKWLMDSGRRVLIGSASLVNFFSLLIITPVVAFYILVDWKKMLAALDSLLPLQHRGTLHEIAAEIDGALAGFIRGQSLVCLFNALWFGVGLTLIGLDYGFLIGILGGVLSFVPYVGSLLVLVLASIVSLVQEWPRLHEFFLALAVVISGQFLESNVMSPKLVGESIGLHPVWLMFALFAAGEWFGFVGLLVAVPMAAAIGVLVRHFVRVYRRSPLYLGETGEASP